MDNITPSAKPSTQSSPKAVKLKAPASTITLTGASYGCGNFGSFISSLFSLIELCAEHLQSIFREHKKISATQYKYILQAIFNSNSALSQTPRSLKGSEGRPITSLTPTYLCLQCPGIFTKQLRDKHWEEKSHAFCEMRSIPTFFLLADAALQP